jgi:hypothetical protein
MCWTLGICYVSTKRNVWDTRYMLLTYEKECVGHSVYVAYLRKGMCWTLGMRSTQRLIGLPEFSVSLLFYFFLAFHVAHMNVRN